MNLLKTELLCAVAVLALAVDGAKADTLTLGGGWDTFYFQGDNSSFQDIGGTPLQFDFTLTGKAFLKVTDAYFTGDLFDVTINNIDQGPTSPYTLDNVFTDNFDIAFHNASWSSAHYYLTAGTYVVTGVVLNSPYNNGAAGIELASNIPEPAGWAMILTGFGALGGLARRRRSTAAC